MHRQTLTDARYHTIGYMDTARDGQPTGRDARYHVVGYDAPRTATCDARHYLVGHGNLLATLIAGR